MFSIQHSTTRGIGLIEVILATATFALFVAGFSGAYLYGEESTALSGSRARATLLAEEGLEAVRNIRDEDFSSLADGTYGLATSSNTWILSGSSDTTDIYTREITIATVDSNRKTVTAQVSWQQNPQRTGLVTLVTRLTNWALGEASWAQTTQAEFNSGGYNSTESTNTDGGEVQLEVEGDWTAASQHMLLDLSGGSNAEALFQTSNTLWVARADSTVYEYDISDVSRNTLTETDTYSIGGNTPTGLYVAGGKAYVSSTNGNEVAIIDLASDSIDNNINLTGGANATDIYIANNKILISRLSSSEAEFYVYDITGNNELGIVEVGADVNAIVADGSYAYLATADGDELWVVDYNDCTGGGGGNECIIANQYDPTNGGGSDGESIFKVGNNLYLGRANNYIHSLNVSNPLSITENYDVDPGNDAVTDLYVDEDAGFIYASTDDGGSEEVNVIRISDQSVSDIDLDGGANANAIEKQGRFIYVASDDGEEIKVWQGGLGGWTSVIQRDTFNTNGNDNGQEVFVSGDYAYVGTDDRFYVLNISNSDSVIEEDNVDFNFDINDVYVSGNYAYLATDDNGQELTIVDVSNPSNISQVGTLNLDSGANAISIWVDGTTAYVGTTNNNGTHSACVNGEFYVVNVAVPATPVCLGSYDVAQNVNDIEVLGSFAYLATNSGTQDLLVLDVSVPATPSFEGSYDAATNWNGLDVEGSTVYGAGDDGGGSADFYVVDITTPSSPSLTVGYDTGDQNNSVHISGNNAYLATNQDSEGFTILDITNAGSGSISQVGAFNTSSDCNGIHFDGTYAHLACEDNSDEYQIFSQASAATNYSLEGWYTSVAFDSSSSATTWTELAWTEATSTMAVDWFDAAYGYRQQITVSTGANAPSGTYDGYTVQFDSLNTQSLIGAGKMQSDCDDLRIAYDTGASWQEIPRHVIDCNTTTTDVRFALTADIADSSQDTDYYLYYGNGSATAPTALGTTNVYLWYDDATSDRSSSYTFGRCDAWHGSGYTAWSYNGSGYYEVDTGDNFTGCLRHATAERDAYIEAEFFHEGCYPSNMTTGVMGRYVLGSGSGGTESASHYYASNRAHQSSCGGGYSYDGDILEGARTSTAVTGTDPAAITLSQWRKQALAIWGINSTNLTFWDNDTVSGFGPVAFPTIVSNANGTDGSDQESAGDWGIIGAQDDVRVQNILIRRYTSPEPSLSFGTEEPRIGDPTGDIQFRLRTAPDSGGTPGTWSAWLGPTSEIDYYTASEGDTINSTHSSGANDQWVQFRAYLTAASTSTTPILHDVTVTYQ